MKVVNLYQEKYTVYIGRPGRGQDGYFGNPCAIGKTCPECGTIHRDGGSTLPCFERYARRRIGTDPIFRARVKSLINETLGCFCKPKPCHGDIYMKLSKELNETRA